MERQTGVKLRLKFALEQGEQLGDILAKATLDAEHDLARFFAGATERNHAAIARGGEQQSVVPSVRID